MAQGTREGEVVSMPEPAPVVEMQQRLHTTRGELFVGLNARLTCEKYVAPFRPTHDTCIAGHTGCRPGSEVPGLWGHLPCGRGVSSESSSPLRGPGLQVLPWGSSRVPGGPRTCPDDGQENCRPPVAPWPPARPSRFPNGSRCSSLSD